MSFIDKIFGSGAVKLADGVASIVDRFVHTPEEKANLSAALNQELNRHMEAMRASILRENELENLDRDSARNREVAHIKATGKADHFQYFVGGIAMLTFLGVTVFLLNLEIPKENGHIVINLIGILEGAVISIITYYFGSSRMAKEPHPPPVVK